MYFEEKDYVDKAEKNLKAVSPSKVRKALLNETESKIQNLYFWLSLTCRSCFFLFFLDDLLQKWSKSRCCLWKPLWRPLLSCNLPLQELHSEYNLSSAFFPSLPSLMKIKHLFFFRYLSILGHILNIHRKTWSFSRYVNADNLLEHRKSLATYVLMCVFSLPDERYGLGSRHWAHTGRHAVPRGDWRGRKTQPSLGRVKGRTHTLPKMQFISEKHRLKETTSFVFFFSGKKAGTTGSWNRNNVM